LGRSYFLREALGISSEEGVRSKSNVRLEVSIGLWGEETLRVIATVAKVEVWEVVSPRRDRYGEGWFPLTSKVQVFWGAGQRG